MTTSYNDVISRGVYLKPELNASMRFCIVEREYLWRMGDNFNNGWGSGYVFIPENHPLYGAQAFDYAARNIEVHGGLAYGGSLEDFITYVGDISCVFTNGWVFGFNTDVQGDTKKSCTKKFVYDETMSLFIQLHNMMRDVTKINTGITKLNKSNIFSKKRMLF